MKDVWHQIEYKGILLLANAAMQMTLSGIMKCMEGAVKEGGQKDHCTCFGMLSWVDVLCLPLYCGRGEGARVGITWLD